MASGRGTVRRIPAAAAGAVLAVLVVACSATTPTTDRSAAPSLPPLARGDGPASLSSDASAGATARATPSAALPPVEARPTRAPTEAAATRTDGMDAPAPADDDAAPCPVPVVPGAPGVTETEIVVGAPRLTNVTATASALERPDAELHEYVEAMIDQINADGGVACRRVRVVWHEVDRSAMAWFGPAAEQAMCQTWTQDDRVFAAFPAVDGPADVLYPCLDRAGVAIIDVRGQTHRDTEAFQEVPRLIAVNGPRMDRATEELVHALVRTRFLTAARAIGVVHYDGAAETRTVDEALRGALAAHDLSIARRRAITAPVDAATVAARDRDVANAVLDFKLAGVDRVLFVSGDGLAASFMSAAEANRYRPRYGLTSVELPVVLLEVPERQLIGARGIGWYPDTDVYPRRPASWGARTGCLEFYHERGFPTSTFLDRVFAVSTCDAAGFLEAAVDAAPRPLSADGLVAGAMSLGDRYVAASVGPTHFGPGQRDGVVSYHDVIYDRDCGCFVHVGDAHPLR